MRAERFMFFGKFYMQAKKMPDDERLAFYDAIFAYGFEGEVKDLSLYPRADVAMVNVIDLVDDSVNRCNKGKESVMKRWGNTNNRSEQTPIIGDNGTLPYEEKRREEKRSEEEENGSEHTVPPAGERENDLDLIRDVIFYLNEKTGSSYKPTSEANKKLIRARVAEGYDLEDFEKVIDNKCRSWLNREDMKPYLRPETLFAKSHFESYLNELQPRQSVYDPEGFAEFFDNL